MSIIKIFGSLKFALILISTMTLILIMSTTLESHYGTPFAQKIFYQAGWFDVFLGLLAVNIFCSTLTRFPFKKKHTGFIITHIGILILLAGSLMSRLWGIDGQMALYEGEKSSRLLKNTFELSLHRDPAMTIRIDLKQARGQNYRSLDTIEPGLKLSIDQVMENAKKNWSIEDGGTMSAPNAAIELSLESERAGVKNKLRLVEKNPYETNSNTMPMGPATLMLKRGHQPSKSQEIPQEINMKNPALILKLPGTDKVFSVNLSLPNSEEIPLGDSGLKIQSLLFYPDARVGEKNQLVSASQDPVNPAVEFDLLDGKGRKEHVIFFSLFPDFESIHGKNADKIADLHPQIQVPAGTKTIKTPEGPSLTFSIDGDRWSYVSQSSKSTTNGDLLEGKTYPTGWMDFHFTVHKLLSRAVVHESMQKTGEGKGYLAAHVSLLKEGGVLWHGWLLEDESMTLGSPLEGLEIAVRKQSSVLPFSLTLKDFRKVDYPSTQNAMSFESDALLEDASENTTIQKTISMNKPLDYKGYRIFQSSYIQDADQGEASVFTIAKNPGIAYIYSGACITFLGILIVFFIKPLSSFKYL